MLRNKKRDLRSFYYATYAFFGMRPTAEKGQLRFPKKKFDLPPKNKKNFPLLILSPALKRWGPSVGDGRGDAANLPTCGPLLICHPL